MRPSLKRRIVLPLSGGLAVLLGAFLLIFGWSRKTELSAIRDRDRAAVQGYLGAQVRAEADMMSAVLHTLTAEPLVHAAFARADTGEVLRLTRPVFDRISENNGIDLFTFLTPDRVPFLHVHAPDDYTAEPDTSATIRRAEQTGGIAAGIELGRGNSPISLRVILPWHDADRLLGYVALGQSIEHVGRNLTDVVGVDLVVTLYKGPLDRDAWTRATEHLGPEARWDRLADDVVLLQSFDSLPPDLERAIVASLRTGTRDFDTAADGRRYFATALPLRDGGRREIGMIFFVRDQTSVVAAVNRSILLAAVIALVVGLVCAYAIDRAVRQHFLYPIRNLHAAASQQTSPPDAQTARILSGYEIDDLALAIDRLIADLREAQEQRTRLIIDAALDAVVTFDENMTITGWNRQAESIFGWSRGEAAGRKLTETILPPELRATHEEGMRAFLENGESPLINRRMELTALRQDGERVPVELATTAIRHNERWSFSAFIRDITERTQAEEALRVSDARFRRLVSLANVVPWEADAVTLEFGYIDPRIERLLGYPSGEWKDAAWGDHIHPEDRDAAVARIRDASLRSVEAELEYRMVAAEGWTAWIRDIVSPERTADGTRLLRGFRFDVTERKRLEEQLYGAQKMEAVGRLAGGIAHDFNNIITAILGYASFIQTQLRDDDPLREDVAEIGRAANRAANLTQQILAFARRRVIQPRVVILNDLVRGVEKMLRRLSGESVEVVIRAEDALWPVKVDPGQLEQVIVNLVVNARDAMPDGGRLTIETANATLHDSPGQRPAIVSGPYVMISVSDTGVGMDEQTKARIFEPFFTTKRVGEGTGLGLATCYGIVKQASGYIWAFSEIGKGTTLRIYLPCADEAPDALDSVEAQLPGPGGHETILLAEDQPQVRTLAERALTNRGFTVLTAENGEQAVQIATDHEGPIQLLLTDIVMPIMGGREAADRITAARPDIRVLFMSGYSEQDVTNPTLSASTSGFIAKPFTPKELEHAVRAVLDGTARQDASVA